MLFSFISVSELIGRFHPVVVHLPIGILLIALLLQWLFRNEQSPVVHRIMKIIWLSGLFSALLACITGYLLSLEGDYEDSTVAWHMWMGIGVTVLSLFVCLKIFSRQDDVLYKFSAFALLLLLFVTGHLGGSLTHGAGYLTAGLNASDNTTTVAKPIANIQEAKVYDEVVQPVLQAKCYSCHGARKQKGKLRLDDPKFLEKGGEDGPVIVANRADESELIKRLLVPKEDKKHMPPKAKPQLTEKQITLLHWWVEQGASYDKKVKELEQPEKIKPVLMALEKPVPVRKDDRSIPPVPVEPADEKAVQALKEKGVVVLPVALNSNYLMANFVTANGVSDKDMTLLLPVKKQLIWLKLADAGIGDEAVKAIGQCSNLTLLQLNGTKITDNGLSNLASLTNLISLNLVGTNVSINGLKQLQPLKRLESLYLYQTRVGRQDSLQVRKFFPKTAIDFGGYNLPLLPTDTTLVKQQQ